jgi:DNA (cytosine-5)-methyltransferase 1
VGDGGRLTSLEVCAGAGGQALGLEQAGFEHIGLVELDAHACQTLRARRPDWKVIESDLHLVDGRQFRGVDLLAGGVPCPPFSVAGKRLGADDERDLFPEMLRLADEAHPRAIMVENVRGLLDPVFADYRSRVIERLTDIGYVVVGWQLLNASDFGVPQLRPRSILVALRPECAARFEWPKRRRRGPPTVGRALLTMMAAGGWQGAESWAGRASTIAPTLVGGSKKHGGPDLGPTRAKRAWADLGVDGLGIADAPPPPEWAGNPRLTVEMCARLQGFPRWWRFEGGKTAAYRQVGNAFPPPVARAMGRAIHRALVEGD